jgi:hypothetical protein
MCAILLCQQAIAGLKQQKGSISRSIVQYIEHHHQDDAMTAPLLRKKVLASLKQGVESGRYSLPIIPPQK